MLLVSMDEGPTKTYQYDGFKFEKTPVTFSGGSFGRGVSRMRTYKINDEILVIGMYKREPILKIRSEFSTHLDYFLAHHENVNFSLFSLNLFVFFFVFFFDFFVNFYFQLIYIPIVPLIFQVVANSEMYRDATNLFRAKFTVTTDYDFTKAFEMFDNWYVGVQQKLYTNQIVETFHEIEVSVIAK